MFYITRLINMHNFWVFFNVFFFSSLKAHKQFVNCVRYSPDGSVFVTAGADGKVSTGAVVM